MVADDEHPDVLVRTRANNLFGWQAYLGEFFGGNAVPAYAAASRPTHLAALPRALVAVGNVDLFLEGRWLSLDSLKSAFEWN